MESPTRPKEIEDPARTETVSGNTGTSLNNTEGPFFCECGKVCQRKGSLTQHKARCNKSLSSQAEASTSSSQTVASTSITYSCDLCNTHCTTSRSLKQHRGSGLCVKRQQKSMTLTLALSKTGSTVVSTIEETDEGAKTPQAADKTVRENDSEKTIEADTNEQDLPERCDGGKETEHAKDT